MAYLTLDSNNIENEHICCGFSDKKSASSYEKKKEWLKAEFKNSYVFRRIDERAKVFIEYGPAEKAWVPIIAPNYLHIGCFWVSGKYKKNGHGKALIQSALDDAITQKKDGLVTIVGTKKFHFMSDTKWFLKNGFTQCDSTSSGFSLLTLKLNKNAEAPTFSENAKIGKPSLEDGLVIYYSNRCPFTDYHINVSLKESCEKRGLKPTVIKFNSLNEAQNSPTPATIFSLFYKGKFVTTDLSACMDSRFDKIMDSII